ncbi:hypothetical protein K438DRAFT_1783209 [Mycena galopus ATCC 62051]|nr:hypothetical protein K438DRAFT_1783209 [Mycena galopus ATCC 62051]
MFKSLLKANHNDYHPKTAHMPSSYTPLTPTRRREICVLRDMTTTPFEEIGAKLDCDKSTVLRNYHKFDKTHDWYQTTRGRPRAMGKYQCRLTARKIRSGVARDAADLKGRNSQTLAHL